MTDENINKQFFFYFFSIIFYFLKPTKRLLQILLWILKDSNLIEYKSSFKSHKQFKTNSIYIKILQLNRKLDAGEVISGIVSISLLTEAKQRGTVHRSVPQV